MTKQRREEVKRVRAEGYAAAIKEEPSHRNPYQHGGCNWSQWLTGYGYGLQDLNNKENGEEIIYGASR